MALEAPVAAAAEDVFRQFAIPLLATYLLFIAMLVTHSRRPAPSRNRGVPSSEADVEKRPRRTWGQLLRFLLATVTGGYLCFLLIVGLYYWLLANQTPRFLREAVTGGGLLAYCLVLPAFLILAWLEDLSCKRGGDPPATRGEPLGTRRSGKT